MITGSLAERDTGKGSDEQTIIIMKIFNASNLTFEALSTPINMTDNPTQKHDRHQYTAFLKLDTAQKKE